jgi:hypothetical protein
MTYEAALSKSWQELGSISRQRNLSVRFLSDEYTIDLENKRVFSLSCNIAAKDHLSILLLHYLIQEIKGLPLISGGWVSFKQLAGGQGYYPVFKKRVIDIIAGKYGSNPDNIFNLVERFGAKRLQLADASVVLEAFRNVPLLITVSRADEEFAAEANVLFDESITDIFCTEDIVILSEFIAHNI